MRILMILIPDNQASPVLKIGQVIEPYYLFRDSGAEVVIASPAGGDPVSTAAGQDRAAAVRRFRDDHLARDVLADTLSLDQVSAEDFQAAFCIGASEQIDAGGDHPASALIAELLDAGKPVAMLSDVSGVRLLITGNAPRPAAQALLGALANSSGESIPQ
jgi:putative intracellular protease/amidase